VAIDPPDRLAKPPEGGMNFVSCARERENCVEWRRLTESSFYTWRKRLQQTGPVRFALADRSPRRQESAAEAALELVLATGERLRISAGVDAATLRTVLDGLRA